MNCKPGDLAVIVRADGDRKRYIGQFLTVTAPYFLAEKWFWHYEGPTRFFDPSTGAPLLINDSSLQPIRPPKKGETRSNPREIETA